MKVFHDSPERTPKHTLLLGYVAFRVSVATWIHLECNKEGCECFQTFFLVLFFFNGIIAEKCTKISSDVASVLHKLYRGVDSACGSRFAFVSHLSLLL